MQRTEERTGQQNTCCVTLIAAYIISTRDAVITSTQGGNGKDRTLNILKGQAA